MSLLVQDDTGTIAGANSYITVAEFTAYHASRDNVYTATDSKIETALVRAADYLDQRFNFRGQKLTGRSQTTMWPRMSCWDNSNYPVNGIPVEVKDSQAEYALRALTAALNPDPTSDATGAAVQAKLEVVGPIKEETTFVSGATFQIPNYPAADLKLTRAGLVVSGGRILRA
jgi:hypothetical protein